MSKSITKFKHIKKYEPPKVPDIPWNPFGQPQRHTGRRSDMRKRPVKKVPQPIVKGDLVQVLTGKDQGKQGKVVKVVEQRTKVLVEGVNVVKVEMDSREKDEKGATILKMQPVPMADVGVVDPTDNLPCTTVNRYTAEGEKVRVSTRTGRIIPKPPWERQQRGIRDGSYDTTEVEVKHNTYVPSLLYFHEEILLSMNKKPTIPKKKPEKRDLIFQHIKSEMQTDFALPADQQLDIYKPSFFLRSTLMYLQLTGKLKAFLFPQSRM